MENIVCSLPEIMECPNKLTEEQLHIFKEVGYLAFDQVLTTEQVAECKRDFRDLVKQMVEEDGFATLETSKGTGNYAGKYYQKTDSELSVILEPGFEPENENWEEIERNVRKYFGLSKLNDTFSNLIHHDPKIQGILTSIIGADPVNFSAFALVKPAKCGGEKPWHQDNAYFDITPLDSVIGVWIALDDATAENGCMHVLPGGHHMGSLKHCHTFDCQIMPGRIDESQAVPVEIKAGGAMFFYGMLPHFTPANKSDKGRRAMQFHYHSADAKKVDSETYNRVFAEKDGTPASCKAAADSF